MTFYGNAVDFDTYHTDRGRTVSASWTTDDIEAALLLASEWLDDMYRNVWSGYPTDGYSQVRKWPRTTAMTNSFPQYVFTDSEIPTQVVSATYEAAFRELTTAGALRKDFTPFKYNKVSISGALSVEYNTSMTNNDVQLQIPVVGNLMSELLENPGQGSLSPYSGGAGRA